MVFHAFDTHEILRTHLKRALLLVAVERAMQMDDTILCNNVQQMGPWLSSGFSDELLSGTQ